MDLSRLASIPLRVVELCLLARVLAPDANGAGGTLIGVASQFVGPTPLGSVTEVPLTNGSGIAGSWSN